MHPTPPFTLVPIAAGLLTLGFGAPHALDARQAGPGGAADSAAVVVEARAAQAGFERFRESRIPVSTSSERGRCDERIGRLCVWFGGEGEADFPAEPLETEMARLELIRTLSAGVRVRDPWVVGQLVHYLVEDGDFGRAEQVARSCDLDATWWCSALLGYVLHLRGDFVEAEEAFLEAVARVPAEEEARWRTLRFLLSRDAQRALDAVEPAERERLQQRFWRLSDPLFLREGNDRLTDHYARLVEAVNSEQAANPYGMEWEEDLEESLVRYGRSAGWSRTRSAPTGLQRGVPQLQDARRVVGHHHPNSRGYLFPDAFLEAPADIPPESWITTPRESRTWYAAPYAPDFRGLETQVARFRRDGEMLVIGAFRPTPAERDPFGRQPLPREEERWDPFGGGAPPPPPPDQGFGADGGARGDGPVESGFFLVPEDGGEVLSVSGTDREGVFMMRAPPGRYVSSVEVLEEEAGRAWRARQGVNQAELTRGLVAVSDLLLLDEGAPLPGTLEEAIPLTRPGIRVGRDERFALAWEVYGLDVDEQVEVTLGFTAGRPGFLTRVGEFLGVLEPDRPIEITFTEPGPDRLETVFRAVELQAPDVEPGEYTLHLRLDLPGREPAIASRPIVVEP